VYRVPDALKDWPAQPLKRSALRRAAGFNPTPKRQSTGLVCLGFLFESEADPIKKSRAHGTKFEFRNFSLDGNPLGEGSLAALCASITALEGARLPGLIFQTFSDSPQTLLKESARAKLGWIAEATPEQ
jgi:hypothetical protein